MLRRKYIVKGVERKTLWLNNKDVVMFRLELDSAKDSETGSNDTVLIHINPVTPHPQIGDTFWIEMSYGEHAKATGL